MLATTIATTAAVLFCYPTLIGAQQQIGEVVAFNLIQGGSGKVVANLIDGSIVTVPSNTIPNFGLVAVTAGGPITSVLFGYNNNSKYRVENFVPYALCGDTNAVFRSCPELVIGTHRVNATITNTGKSSVINFQIVYGTAPSPLAALPVRTPVLAPVTGPVMVPTRPAPFSAPMPLPTNVRSIITLKLVDTITNTDILTIVNGTVVNLTNFEQASFNIRADAPANTLIQSIRFLPIDQNETLQPWAYCGSFEDLYNDCADFTSAGVFAITARPYTGT
jgi:hypothetical protein